MEVVTLESQSDDSDWTLGTLVARFESEPNLARDPELLEQLDLAWADLDSRRSEWSPEVVERLMEAMECIADDFEARGDAEVSLSRLRDLYRHGQTSHYLRQSLERRFESISDEQVRTTAWLDLLKVLQMARDGLVEPVEAWIEAMDERFQAAVAEYSELSIVEDEITAETVLCDEYLQSGIDCWLLALERLEDCLEHEYDEEGVLEAALEGQKSLLVVKTFHSDLQKRQEAKGLINSVCA